MQISSSKDNTPFSDVLRKLISRESQNLPSEDWIHFLQDHRMLIEQNSTTYTLDEETMLRYRYRIRDFLKEVAGYRSGMEQAFRVVNRLHNDQEFDLRLTSVFIPNNNFVTELRRMYNTLLARQKKAFT